MATSAETWRENLETTYEQLRPSLLRVLARLSRQGFVVPVSDGLDLVHDFFLSEWPAILRTFDARLGTLERYAATAFERFARTHVARQWRRRERLLDARVLADRVADSREDGPTPAAELRRLHEALAGLDAEDRSLLDDYFGTPGKSERGLARDRGMTRHRLRDELLQALARVAVAFGDRGLIPPEDWRVAREIWGMGWTTREVAGRLGASVQDVVQARNRVLNLLARGLGRGGKLLYTLDEGADR
ncbi:hypothetical protein [Paludisphaera sp.]|uniref:RNA polymerase sigma factor n=1 Tax=Paludisphaera sp. TaxID=2017432 RepID=UPI00301BF2C0